MVAIIDYGVGNLFSLKSSLKHIGAQSIITADENELKSAERVILPGVGAFGNAVEGLKDRGLDKLIKSLAQIGKPILGICLGMQILYERSFEFSENSGLGIIPGDIISLADKVGDSSLKIPHMGWNNITFKEDSIFPQAGDKYVYYVHSFYAPVNDYTIASSKYGDAEITGIVKKDNVFGMQFHPEKSGDYGLSLLESFVNYGEV